MTGQEVVAWLRTNAVETGSLICFGCGYEHHCGIQGCRVLLEAAKIIEAEQGHARPPKQKKERANEQK